MTWQSLNNLYSGKPGIIIGRGPSLDQWLEEGSPKPDDSVVIGINGACDVTPCDFSVSCDADANSLVGINTKWVRGIPYITNSIPIAPGKVEPGRETWELPSGIEELAFYHGEHDAPGRDSRIRQTRKHIELFRRLYCSSSSMHPAIHFAWYLGCQKVMVVGMDGHGGRAKATQHLPGKEPPPDHIYAKMRTESENLLNTLFPNAWVRYPN